MNSNAYINQLYVLNQMLDEIVEEKFETKHKLGSLRYEFIAFSFGKAYKTHKAILMLCEKGFGEDAAVLARSLFELGISTLYLLSDETGYLINRYYDYDWILRKEPMDHAKAIGALNENSRIISIGGQEFKVDIEEIYREAAKVQDKYHYDTRKGWSDKSIKQMATVVGRENEYKTNYNLLSQVAHTAPRTINSYVSFEDGGYVVNSGSSTNWVSSVLITSFDHLHHISIAWDKLFDLGLGEKLENLKRGFLKTIENINSDKVNI